MSDVRGGLDGFEVGSNAPLTTGANTADAIVDILSFRFTRENQPPPLEVALSFSLSFSRSLSLTDRLPAGDLSLELP